MPPRAILNFTRAILVGLMSLFGLISAASQQSSNFELRLGTQTDQRGAPQSALAHIATASVPSRADLPDNGTKQALIGRGNPFVGYSFNVIDGLARAANFFSYATPASVAVKLAPPSHHPLCNRSLLWLVPLPEKMMASRFFWMGRQRALSGSKQENAMPGGRSKR